MTPERLSRIRRIYEEALPMTGSARDAHLKQECHGEEMTRLEIERLLKEGLVRREESEVTRKPLWDNWPFLIVFVSLLAAEWTIRKLRGLV